MACAAGCAHCTGMTSAKQRCQATNTCKHRNISFSESSRKTMGKIRVRLCPDLNQLKHMLGFSETEGEYWKQKKMFQRQRQKLLKQNVKEKRVHYYGKRKKNQNKQSNFRNVDLPKQYLLLSSVLVTVLSLLTHSINTSSNLPACFYGVWDAGPWLCMRLLQLHWNRLWGPQKNLQTRSASLYGLRNESTNSN